MVREDGKRNFALQNEDGSELSEFSGNMPRQAALKAARTLDPAPSEEEAERVTLRLREKGTEKVHEYEGWAWKDSAPEVDEADDDFWLNDLHGITKANVSKQGVRTVDNPSGRIRPTEDTRIYRTERSFDRQGREPAAENTTETNIGEESEIPDEVHDILEEANQAGTSFEVLSDLTREEVNFLLNNTEEVNVTEHLKVYETAMQFYDQELEISQYSPEDILNLQRISKFGENNGFELLAEMADKHSERYFEAANFDSEVISRASSPKRKLSIDEAQERLENRIQTLSTAIENYELSDKETEEEIVDALTDQYLRILLKAI